MTELKKCRGPIALIGGIGPAAGLNLARLLTEQLRVQKDQEHLPWILVNLPERIVDRTDFLLGKETENPGDEIARQILLLEELGCSIAGIACNTAHAPPIFDRIRLVLHQANSQIELLHVIDELVAYVQRNFPTDTKIGILGTSGSYLSHLHTQALEDAGFACVDPGIKRQEELIHQSIYHPEWGIKAHPDPPAPEALAGLQATVDYYRSQEVKALVLGCSEISLVIDQVDCSGLQLIRPMSILANKLAMRHMDSLK